MMKASPTSPSAERPSRIRAVIDDVIGRRARGEAVTDVDVASSHADLMPELGEELRRLAVVQRGYRAALEAPKPGSSADELTQPPGAEVPAIPRIAGYDVLGEIHRGGQGVVYRAEQLSTGRTVAIKVLREGPFAGAADRARFEREVHVLAKLEHPNIVTIHDSGAAAGHYYFVMDFIEGRRLDEYVAKTENQKPKADIKELLSLFAKICDAVHAAHLRGVIHRDLKPGNILVDAGGAPRVLDFGLAKLIGGESEIGNRKSEMTLPGQFVGSLPWASPEQALGQHDSIDLRTDVYSLGVVLYQALTARSPYPDSASTRELLNHIVATEPIRPSSAGRGRLARVDDELETIVLKCLQKDPARRYQTAGELGRDIERYLAGEPIEAKRDSGWYVFRKTLARHKLAAGVAATFVALVTISAVAFGTMYRREHTARRQAVAAKHEAETINSFLQNLLAWADPNVSEASELTMREALEAAANSLTAGKLAGQPGVEAAVRRTIGNAYVSLADYARADEQLRAALAIRQRELGSSHPDVAESLMDLAELLRLQGALPEAESCGRDALDICRKHFGNEHPQVATGLNRLAEINQDQGRYAEAEVLLRQALELHRRLPESDEIQTALVLNNLAVALYQRGDHHGAEELHREALDVRLRLFGEESLMVAQSRSSLGQVLQDSGHFDEAEALLRQSLDVRRRLLDPHHPRVATTLNNLAALLQAKGDLPEAEALLREASDIYRGMSGEPRPELVRTLGNLAMLMQQRGDLAAARSLLEESLDVARKKLGPDHPDTAKSMANLAGVLERLGDLAAAERLERDALEILRRTLGHGHLQTAVALHNLAANLGKQGRPGEAVPLMREALDAFHTQRGEDDPETLHVKNSLDALLRAAR